MIATAEMGRCIRRARVREGLTQGQLAEKLCVSAQAVSNWERGANRIDEEIKEKLEEMLGIQLSEIPHAEEEFKMDLVKIEDFKDPKELNDVLNKIVMAVPVDTAFEASVRKMLYLLLVCITGYEINIFSKNFESTDGYGYNGWESISSNLYALLDDEEEYPIRGDLIKDNERHSMRDKIEYMNQIMGDEMFEAFDDDGNAVETFKKDCARRGEYCGYDLLQLIPGIPNSLVTSFKCSIYQMAELIENSCRNE